MSRKIIITAPAHQQLINRLQAEGCEVMYVPSISYEELSGKISSAEGLIVTTRIKIDKNLINQAERLK